MYHEIAAVIKIVLLVVLLVSAWLGLSSLERRSLYFPDRQVFATPQVYRLAYEDLALTDGDGTRIHGWFIPKAGRPAPGLTLLFCHGNAGNISHRLDKVLKFHQMGLNVLLFDYRGYGQSEGRPSEAGTYLDAGGHDTYAGAFPSRDNAVWQGGADLNAGSVPQLLPGTL